jgi:3-hydroxymyristoyl/3-hydroxydecanoyl-(acyl carrier protein) dehydratase
MIQAAAMDILHGHPWVAHAVFTQQGVVISPTAAGVAALRQQGRRSFVQSLEMPLVAQGMTVPTSWRLCDEWPAHADVHWASRLLAEPRPDGAMLLGEQSLPGQATLALRIPLDLRHFDVHFPPFPVLPGVVQLAWALSFGTARLGTPDVCRRMEMLKFLRPVRPGDEVMLTLRYDADLRRLHFAYAQGDLEYSSGRLVWDRTDD